MRRCGRGLKSVAFFSPSKCSRVRPSTPTAVKRRVYKEKGVPEYWVVDTDARTVERYRPDDSVEILSESLEWQPDYEVPALVIDLPACFDRVHGIA